MKEFIIIAGANGSGKTTFARPFVREMGYRFLNADDLAKEYEERGFENALIKAGRDFFTILERALETNESIVVETTLSGTYITPCQGKRLLRIAYLYLPRITRGMHAKGEEPHR